MCGPQLCRSCTLVLAAWAAFLIAMTLPESASRTASTKLEQAYSNTYEAPAGKEFVPDMTSEYDQGFCVSTAVHTVSISLRSL